MAAKIRLHRFGTKKRPHFKIVVCDSTTGRDSKTIEEIGFYDPSKNPPILKINKERANYWLNIGAQATETIKAILKKA